jgi:putative ABC transport system ATP-binding protein
MPNAQSEASTDSVLKLERVSRSYQMGAVEVKALSGIELDITTGDFVVILGPSGSGKTTLLNLVGGIHDNDPKRAA